MRTPRTIYASGRKQKREKLQRIDRRDFRQVRSLIVFHHADADTEARNRERPRN